MNMAVLTAVGVAAATVLGAYLGERIGAMGEMWSAVLQMAGVVLMAAIVVGVLRMFTDSVWAAALLIGLLCAAEFLECRHMSGQRGRMGSLLTVLVIAGHHFPEGLAAGVGCTQGGAAAWVVCGAVVLHSIPETMVIMPTMHSAGYHRKTAYLAAAVSGAMEIAGVLLGSAV